MATPTDSKNSPNENSSELKLLSLEDVAKLLAKHYGITEGLYDLAVEFKVGIGAVGPANQLLPGAMVGVSGFGLKKATKKGPNTIDVAKINSETKNRKKSQG